MTIGKQEVTFTQSGRTGHVSVRVLNDTAYFRGDAFALQAFMSVPADNAARYAGAWVRVQKTATQYASIAAGATLPSFAGTLGINGTVTKVKGGLTSHLPTRETGKGTGGTLAMTIGRWNETVRIAAPADTVPVETVYRTTPGAA